MKLMRLLSPLVVTGLLLAPQLANAETTRVAPDTKFVVRLDLQEVQGNPCGQMLVEFLKTQAMAGLHDAWDEGSKPKLEKINEILGFDPLKEIQSLIVSSSDYEHPESSLVVRVNLRKTTGNIEGLLLGIPGYASEAYGKHQIHSANPGSNQPIFAAIHSGSSDAKTIVLAVNRAALTESLDQLDGQAASGSMKDIELSEGKSMVSVRILSLPMNKLEGPPANIAKILSTLGLDIRENNGDLQIAAALTADTDQHAEQLKQMAQGLVATIEFAESVDPDNEELKQVKDAVRDVKSEREDNQVRITLNVNADHVKRLLEEVLKD